MKVQGIGPRSKGSPTHTHTYDFKPKPTFSPLLQQTKERAEEKKRKREGKKGKRGKKRRESEPSLAFVDPRTIFTPSKGN